MNKHDGDDAILRSEVGALRDAWRPVVQQRCTSAPTTLSSLKFRGSDVGTRAGDLPEGSDRLPWGSCITINATASQNAKKIVDAGMQAYTVFETSPLCALFDEETAPPTITHRHPLDYNADSLTVS